MTDVPEWSTVDAEEIETGGSFDASGAFLSSKVTELCVDYFMMFSRFVYRQFVGSPLYIQLSIH